MRICFTEDSPFRVYPIGEEVNPILHPSIYVVFLNFCIKTSIHYSPNNGTLPQYIDIVERCRFSKMYVPKVRIRICNGLHDQCFLSAVCMSLVLSCQAYRIVLPIEMFTVQRCKCAWEASTFHYFYHSILFFFFQTPV